MDRERTIINIEEAARTALIDRFSESNLAYRPQFVSNNYREGKKVLDKTHGELLRNHNWFFNRCKIKVLY